jgi:ribonuclease J
VWVSVFPIEHVYVDQLSGEEVEDFVLRDRERLAKEALLFLMAEISAIDGQLVKILQLLHEALY